MKHLHNLLTTESKDENDVDLTPLIDVVFVVLIVFILIAPLIEIDRIHLATGGEGKKKGVNPSQDSVGIKIHVYEDNSIWLNGTSLTIDELNKQLQKITPFHRKTPPQIIHDHKAFFGTYQLVKNALEDAGFDAADVILKSK